MSFDSVLDSFYAVGALWGALTGPQVCPVGRAAPPRAALEAAWTSGPRTAAAAVTAFVEVNVIPMDSERMLAKQTVLVEDGRITALGPSSKVRVPTGAVRIDGRGKYLIPGLVNMHWHDGPAPRLNDLAMVREFLPEALAQGITTLRAMNDYGVDAMLGVKRLTQEIPSPRIYLAWSRGLRVGMRLDSLNALVTAAKAAGYTHIGNPPQRDFDRDISKEQQLEFMDSLTAAAHRAGLPVSTHVHSLQLDVALKLGVAGGSVDHLYLFWDWEKHQPVSVAQIVPIVAALKRAGVWVTPMLQCGVGAGGPQLLPLARQIVKALHEAGVKLLLGSDEQGVARELALLVSAGLTPYQALETGTRNVAQYLGVQDSGGTVTVGKWADLVLLNDNPLADVYHVQVPAGVMAGGRWVELTEITRRKTRERQLAYHDLLLSQFNFILFGVGNDSGQLKLTEPQRTSWAKAASTYRAAAEALVDSLQGIPDNLAHQRLLPSAARQLGAYRAMLTPTQQAIFDPRARQWLRLHAGPDRQGIIPGVRP